mgnify:CR=1 FL=1|tara:strand:+ start:105 stop:617 length:513 start_codon:yes stop_codon:yes gene_type:complete
MIHSLLSRLGIEVWKDIPEFENYQVSNLGNVRSLNFNHTGKRKVLKKNIYQNRYTVGLYKQDVNNLKSPIAVLVARAFLNHKPCGNNLVVDHIDNISTNDKLYNLQIITHRKNLTKDKKKGTSRYAGVYWDKKSNIWISQISVSGKKKYLGRFKSEQEASEAYQKELKRL